MLGVRDRRGPSSSLSVHRASPCIRRIRSRPSPVPPRAISHHAVAELVTLDPRAARGLGLERPRAARPNERLLVNLHRKYLLAYAARRRSSSPPGAWPRRPRRRKGPPPQPTARARIPRHRRQPRHQRRASTGVSTGVSASSKDAISRATASRHAGDAASLAAASRTATLLLPRSNAPTGTAVNKT